MGPISNADLAQYLSELVVDDPSQMVTALARLMQQAIVLVILKEIEGQFKSQASRLEHELTRSLLDDGNSVLGIHVEE